MCGGGGGGPTQSTVTQTNLPEWAEPYYHDMIARTAYESTVPYEAYPGQRLAYFSPMEQSAIQGYANLGTSGNPEDMDAASQAAYGLTFGWNPNIDTVVDYGGYQPGFPTGAEYNAGTRDSTYTAQYDPNDPNNLYQYGQRDVGFVPGTLADQNMLQRYMDPYQQMVTDVQKREAARQADIRHAQTGLTAAGSGSLGGYREGIMRSEAERNLGYLMDDIQKEGLQDSYRNAQQAFEADRAARAQLEEFEQSQFGMNEGMRQRQAELMQQGWGLFEASRQAQEEFGQGQFGLNQQALQAQAQQQLNAYNAYESARQQAAAFGLSAEEAEIQAQQAAANIILGQTQQQLAAAALMGDLSAQRQLMELERLRSMQSAGMLERSLYQQGLDMGYQDWLRQQAYPREQLALYANMLYGLPVKPGATQTIYGSQPSYAQQLLGLGIGGLGLYNAASSSGYGG